MHTELIKKPLKKLKHFKAQNNTCNRKILKKDTQYPALLHFL